MSIISDQLTGPKALVSMVADEAAIRSYLHALYGTTETGYLAIFQAPGSRTDWVPIADVETAAAVIRQRCDEGFNVYHGMGLHRVSLGPAHRGTAAGVIALPGLYMDLDFASPGAHMETALPRTVDEIVSLLADFALPSSLLVHSGHGLHAHWLFREVLTLDSTQERSRVEAALRQLQNEIQRLGRGHGWKFDSTADLARVLRPPGVVNRKAAPVLSRVLIEGGDRYLLEEIEDILPDEEPTPRHASSDELARADLDSILRDCPFLAHCRDDSAELPEPEWHTMMTVVSLCDGGERSAHELSQDYPGYAYRETQQKYERARTANKPVRCETVQHRHGDAWCAGCAQRGTITSPIQLGYPRLHASERNGTNAQADTGAASPEPPPWEEPVPLPVHEQPGFPTDLLPKPLQPWVDAEAVATQTPPALAAMTTIGVASTAIARHVEVEVRPGWREPTNTYNLVALDSGNRKTAVAQAVGAPLITVQKKRARELAPDIARARAKRDVVEKRLERLKKAQATNAIDDLALDADIRTTAEELLSERLTVPVAPQYLVDDITPEKLADLMGDHGERMGVLSAEGGIFQVIAGRYSDGKADGLDLFLKGHSGDYLPIDRMGRPTKHLEAPALTLTVAPQPEVLAGLTRHPGFRGRGLLARFAYGVPLSTVGRRQVAAPAVAANVMSDYECLITNLLALRGPDVSAAGNSVDSVDGFQPLTVTLSDDAAASFKAFEAWLEPQLARDEGALGDIADWGAKLAGLVARWAGIFHAIEHVQSGGEGKPSSLDSYVIAEETIARVAAIAKTFLIPHARTAFALMGADRSESRAHRVLGVVREWSQETITRRDIHQRTRRSIPDVDDLDRPLALLEEHGYLRRLPSETTGPGRKPSPTFAINPLGRKAVPPHSIPQRQDAVGTSPENAEPSKPYTESTQLRDESAIGHSVDSVYGFREVHEAPEHHEDATPDRENSTHRDTLPIDTNPWGELPDPEEWAPSDPFEAIYDTGSEARLDELIVRDGADHEVSVADVLAHLVDFTPQEVEQFRREVADTPDADPFAVVDRAALARFDREYGGAVEASA